MVVRSPEIYEQVLRATLDRFGIPARFYFDAELDRHALVRYLAGIVDAMLNGWEHAATLAAIRLAPGIACDEFDFAVRESLPGAGSGRPAARRNAGSCYSNCCRSSRSWKHGARFGWLRWSGRHGSRDCAGLFAPGWLEPRNHETAAIGRSQATALDLFAGAMDEAALALGDRPVSLDEFWRTAKSVLRLTPLRVADSRRNVVHVIDAHEARQWRLPVVFVCGLVEKQFPKFHTQDPFFPEAARAQLKQAGIRLRTAADFEAEERFLFDWAVTRATKSLTLSYPRLDARGQQNLPSLYLEGSAAVRRQVAGLRPRCSERFSERGPSGSGAGALASPDILQTLVLRHQAFRPTALESYLQCPFQFFGRYTLRLRGAPVRPEERLDFLMQGNIVHDVLADLHREARPLEETFDRVFRRICEAKRVPRGYRTEAARERMLADLLVLVESPGWKPLYEVRAEQEFHYQLGADVEIRGRIDRVDVSPGGGAFVIDYKYSGAQNTKNRASGENLLQPQLYLLALERCLNLRPDGMSYWGLKGGVQRTAPMPFAPAQAIATTLRIVDEIRAGRLAPHPADTDKCRYCDFRDACRFVTIETAVADGEPAWD